MELEKGAERVFVAADEFDESDVSDIEVHFLNFECKLMKCKGIELNCL